MVKLPEQEGDEGQKHASGIPEKSRKSWRALQGCCHSGSQCAGHHEEIIEDCDALMRMQFEVLPCMLTRLRRCDFRGGKHGVQRLCLEHSAFYEARAQCRTTWVGLYTQRKPRLGSSHALAHGVATIGPAYRRLRVAEAALPLPPITCLITCPAAIGLNVAASSSVPTLTPTHRSAEVLQLSGVGTGHSRTLVIANDT